MSATSPLGSGTAKTGRHASRSTLGAGRPTGRSRKGVPFLPYGRNIRYGAVVELGYARVSTMKQDLDRQIDALEQIGIPRDRIYVDKKSGATTDRPGLREVIAYAREGDVIVVHTLDRLGRTVRDTLNLIHELAQRKIGVRNLADPIKVDSSNPDDPMAQLAVVLLALFGQMERTYAMERAAHARAVATAKGRRIGRPVLVDPAKLDYAAHLRDSGHTIAEIVTKTGIPRTSLYRHLPPRPAPTVTAADSTTSAETPAGAASTSRR
jgi:DNA invertase Pin-like site-specific DNA recombinase